MKITRTKRLLSLVLSLVCIFTFSVWSNAGFIGRTDANLTFQANFDNAEFPLKLRHGVGSLSFSRNSLGTFISPTSGQLEYARVNLLTYSEEFDNAAWTKQNVTVATTQITAPNGENTAYKVDDSETVSTSVLYQSGITIADDTSSYVFSIFLKEGTSSITAIRLGFRGGTTIITKDAVADLDNGTITTNADDAGIENLGNGWYRVWIKHANNGTGNTELRAYLIPAYNSSGDVNDGEDAALTGYIYVWGAQLEEITSGPSEPSVYAKTEASATGALRIEANGALIEESRENLLTNSEDFDSWNDYATPVVAADSLAAPDGETTADTIEDDNNVGLEGKYATATIADDSNPYVFSVFLKMKTSSIVCIHIRLSGGVVLYYRAVVDLDTGQIIEGSGNPTDDFGVESLNNGWYRVWLVGSNNSSGNTFATCYVFPAWNTSLNANVDNTATGSVYAWGAQLEEGSFPTSYIPTTSAAVTRAADDLTMPSSGNFNSSQGTVILGVDAWNTVASGAGPQIFTSSPGIAIPLYQVDGKLKSFDGTSGPAVSDWNDTSYHKIGASWSGSTLKNVMDGGTVNSSSFDGSMDSTTNMDIGKTLNGHIKSLRIWDVALPDGRMQNLTSQ